MAANGTPRNSTPKPNGQRAWNPMGDPGNQYAMGYAQGMASGAGTGEPPGRYQAQGKRQRQQARQRKTTNRTRVTNKERTLNININKGGAGVQGVGQPRGLGDISLTSSGVRDYCERGRRLFREAGESLGYAEQILRKALKETPPPPGESQSAVKARANKVGRSLKRAKYASYAASAQCVRTWTIYTREFEPWMNRLGYREPVRRGMNFGA